MKKGSSVLVISLFLLSTLTYSSLVYSNSLPVSTNFYYSPLGSSGSFAGSVTINANGSLFDGTFYAENNINASGVVRLSGNTYCLVESINQTLTIHKSNSIFNGNNYTVGGTRSGNYDIDVLCVSNDTIESFHTNTSALGVHILSSHNVIINWITLTNVGFGICPKESSNLLVENSSFPDSYFDGAGFINTDQQNTNVSVINNSICISGTVYATRAIDIESNNSKVINNRIISTATSTEDNSGIYVFCSTNTLVKGNYLKGSNLCGIFVLNNNYLNVTNNYINTTIFPLYLCSSENLNVSENTIIENGQPINVTGDHNVSIYKSSLVNTPCSISLNLIDSSNVLISNVDFNQTVICINKAQSLSFSNSGFAGSLFTPGHVSVANSNGIYLSKDEFNCSNLIYTGNNKCLFINKSTFKNLFHGIEIKGANSGMHVLSSIFSGPCGLDFCPVSNTQNVLISKNLFSLQSGVGVRVQSSSSTFKFASITYNKFFAGNDSCSGAGLYLEDITTQDLNIVGNTFVNISLPVYVCSVKGKSITVSNNTVLNTTGCNSPVTDASGINVISFNCGLTSVEITGNMIKNEGYHGICLYGAVLGDVNQNSVNNVGMQSKFQHAESAICISESSFVKISENNILFPSGSSQNGISLIFAQNDKVTENSILNGSDGIHLKYFCNSTVNDNYIYGGINSLEVGKNSYNFTVEGNSIINSSTSIYIKCALFGQIQSNTISGSKNLAVNILDSRDIIFYHNNFINGNTNNATIVSSTSIIWNLSLPVGGNYWSNYTSGGLNGIGTVPYDVSGSYYDYLPLTKAWSSYSITFSENGLPAGTTWMVKFGSTSGFSSSQILTFPQTAALDTIVNYSVPSIYGYVSSASSGSIKLTGQNLTIYVQFKPYLSNISFTESGKPVGSYWTISIDGSTLSTNSSFMNFSVSNGSYVYSISSEVGFSFTGSISVSGNSVVNIEFPAYYNVTFVEKGLPTGTDWFIYYDSYTFNSTSSSLIIKLVSGNYSISASGPSGYSVSLQTSHISVTNDSLTLSVIFQNESNFLLRSYTVSFNSLGKPANSFWSVQFNGSVIDSTNSVINFTAKNGTYDYYINSTVFFETSGYIKVSGKNITENIQFTPVYAIYVNETGLTSGSTWTLFFNGTFYHSSTSSITILAVSGNYSVAASGPSGYTVTIKQPFVVVHGSSVQFNVSFALITNSTKASVKPASGISAESIAIGLVSGVIVGVLSYAGLSVFRSNRKRKT